VSGSKNPGFDAARLDRIPAFLKAKYVDTGRLPHAATLVSRRGEIAHLSLVGEGRPGEALKDDAIFRIASMTNWSRKARSRFPIRSPNFAPSSRTPASLSRAAAMFPS
jgi:hypothetical protein